MDDAGLADLRAPAENHPNVRRHRPQPQQPDDEEDPQQPDDEEGAEGIYEHEAELREEAVRAHAAAPKESSVTAEDHGRPR
eukprot:4794256-Lingulodinium_polyedra.AAC.1